MILGSYIGKQIVDGLPERLFPILIEAVLVISGLHLLLTG
jgi:uncharacterized membrane protein YfcA